MRAWIVLLLLLATRALALSDESQNTALEDVLQNLRSTDPQVVVQTLRSLPGFPGYPESVQPILPALVWLTEHQDDEDSGEEAEAQAATIGWPNRYCLPCIRKFAERQDKIYKLMGLSALVKLAWKDPEAMLMLMEITKNTRRDMGDMVRSVSSDLKHLDCGMPSDMDSWNKRALPLLGRMQSVLASAGWQLRSLATTMAACPMLGNDLKRALQDYLARVPEPRSHLTPTPDTRIY